MSAHFAFGRVALLAVAPALLFNTGGQAVAAAGGSTAAVSSPGSLNGRCGSPCSKIMLSILNKTRLQYHLAPLHLKNLQTNGRAGCAGSMGHSTAMAETGTIWHTNSRFPKASFPNNICLRYKSAGENVGQSTDGSLAQALQTMHSLMMSEPHSKSVCAGTINHACNILSLSFRQVGIGIYVSAGATWLTEDFVS